MSMYSEQQRVLDNDLIEERVKQIALNHFYSYYVRHEMDDVMNHVSDNVRWVGSKDYFVAHNKEEYRNLLQKELKEIPYDCILKVVNLETVTLNPSCYEVSGELELRIPYQTGVIYADLRLSVIILSLNDGYSIVSVHTFMSGEELAGNEVSGQDGKPIRQMAQDMERKKYCDTLTGLYTLDYFKKKVRILMDTEGDSRKYALLCTGISHFEKVNNLYGLKRADIMLVNLATMLTTCSKDVKLCCRSVADHFLVLVAYDEVEGLKALLRGVCEEFNKEIGAEYSEAFPRLGIGVYLVHDSKENVGKIVDGANIARKSLRIQKSLQIAFYDAEIYVRMEKVRKIERIMRDALKANEFKVFLQPKYNLENGEIVGAEALVRWIRGDGTMVYPDEFIPIFEQDGFIVKLDFYMLSRVCEMIQRRRKEKKKCVTVSVNQSRMLLQDADYANKIAAVLAKYNTPPKYIELELTERIFKDNLSDMAQMMEKLKDLGIQWSIDDFGTGYSSLNLLKELPVDVIKIDKSFLDESETSETSKIIIKKTVELTRELDKTVVCEGVETESQAEYLRNIRCDVAQGYLYARPMPMDEFEKLLDKEMYI